MSRLYDELAEWWPLVSAPADYAEEAAAFVALARSHARRPPRSLLELGSGGGNNASHMKAAFAEVTLVDVAPGMLDVSRTLNPECEHRTGDMRTARLGRTFDVVFVHDAVSYITTAADLAAVAGTARLHCARGGVALFVPDHTRESFRPGTACGGHDGTGRGLRYLEWTWDPDPGDRTYVVEYAFMLREGRGEPRLVRDRHVEGLFVRDEWSQALDEAGFAVTTASIDHSELDDPITAFVGVPR